MRVVTERSTGKEFACKSISKQLEIPNISPQKQAAHLDNVKQEVWHVFRPPCKEPCAHANSLHLAGGGQTQSLL